MSVTDTALILKDHQTTAVSTIADLIVDYLHQLDIEYVFGVPGGAIEPFYNALARSERKGGPKAIVARHESGAAFMADGYARETGKIGVVCATTGPGSTNLITGVASALADNVPMLVITAQTPLPKFGKGALQDSSCAAIDTVGIFRHCTRFNTLVSHREQLEHKLISAIMATQRLPSGPVHISIPSDILFEPCYSKPQVNPKSLLSDFTLKDKEALKRLCSEIAAVDRIALFIGDDCDQSAQEIMKLAEMLNAPFATGPVGKRWVDETHPLYQGVFGFGGHQNAKELFHREDIELILAVGASMGELSTGGWADSLLNDRLIHIDASPENFTRSSMAKLHICGHIPTIFKRLNEEIEYALSWGRKWQGVPMIDRSDQNFLGGTFSVKCPEKVTEDISPIQPQRLFTFLAKELPKGTRTFIEAGNAWSWATHYYQRPESDGTYRIAMGFGSMGWAIGAAVGSSIANSKNPTVCLTGDGSYLMSGQEITVAAQHNLPVVYMVLNDSVYGMVMHGQRLGKAEQIGFELNKVNYADMARSMGIDGIVIETIDELESLDFEILFSKEGPTLIDIRIDPEATPPMGDRVKGLQQAVVTPGG